MLKLCLVVFSMMAFSAGAAEIAKGSGFVVLDKGTKAKGQTEFTASHEKGAVKFRIDCKSASFEKFKTWSNGAADTVEVFLSPEGSVQNYYQFIVRSDGVKTAYFFAEKGLIKPDPYDPEWDASVKQTDSGWVCEMSIPLESFYMTRTANWKTAWLVNVTRCDRTGGGLSSWQRCLRGFHEPDVFKKVEGFPARGPDLDAYIEMATMSVEKFSEGRYSGTLRVRAITAEQGEYEFTAEGASKGTNVFFRAERFSKIDVPASFASAGRQRTRLLLKRLSDGRVFSRYYPVRISYEPIKCKLSSPESCNNFYPGQQSDKVAGVAVSLAGGDVTLSLEGPGIPKSVKTVKSGEAFEFATPGFQTGEATLVVSSGGHEKKVKIRKLEKTGKMMTWVSGGNLIVNGKPTFRRDLYAPWWGASRAWIDVYTNDVANGMHLQRDICRGGWLEPSRLMGGRHFEEKEVKKDVYPSREYLDKVDKVIESCKNADFGYYYISDEPDVRGLSEVYLRHVYEYVKERDPYHAILMATRTPAKYVECADWFETHPYLDPHFDASGARLYQHKMNEFGPYLDQMTALNRSDKCIGFLPTAFSYRFNSSFADYPTFDEYVCHVMTALAHGAKTLWPFSGCTVMATPALHEAVRWTFAFTHAFEDILLHGKRELTHPTSGTEKCVWTLGDEKLTVELEYNAPFAVKYAYEGKNSRPLEKLEAVKARAEAAEAERKDPRSLLVGREKDISITLAGKPGSVFADAHYALFDGGRRTLAWKAPNKGEKFVELAFASFTPEFRRIRVSGDGLDGMTVKVWRRRQWVPMEGTFSDSAYEKLMTLDKDTKAIKLRFEFPSKQPTELYEIELLADKAPAKENAEKKPPVFVRQWGVSNMSERVEFKYDPAKPWFVARLDEAVWEEHPTWRYHGWYLQVFPQLGTIAGGGRDLAYATYMAPLPSDPAAYGKKGILQAVVCGMNYTLKFGEFGCAPVPANRIETDTFGKTELGEGDEFEVTLTLADPAEDATCAIRGNAINGSESITLDPVGDDGRVWRKRVKIEKYAKSQKRANETSVQAGALGGTLRGTLITPIRARFK